MTSLTIQLDDRTSACWSFLHREHKQPEAIAADAVPRRLFIDWMEDMNDTLSKRAAQRGCVNEDDFPQRDLVRIFSSIRMSCSAHSDTPAFVSKFS